ncbi:hypothetical protein [Empedobacter brevis]|uniref:hypothetical protein n=1 Tax=Empedobacter brevis TaxID=247 RepID=UPI0028D61028|nr:hypothetical protein [Empedobacter brevis]
MKNSKIEIKLDSVDETYVNLDNMSLKALESFLLVTNSLKNIAETISKDITFTLKKGSAYTAVNGNPGVINDIYNSINLAIEGNSEDEIVTANLRSIQKEIQNQVFNYQFKFGNENLGIKLSSAKKIQKKRTKNHYKNEIIIISGYFNSIGGNDPNYHFDYGLGRKTIVECTIEEAFELKNYLYKTISCLVLKKYVEDDPENTTYTHCSVLKDNQISNFREFIYKINNTTDLLNRLESIYDFLDNSYSRLDDIFVLLKSYKFLFKDVNEYKTLLILSKSLKEKKEIKELRDNLLYDFESLLNKQ